MNVIYGLTNAGTIHAIDVNTGVAGPAINPAYPGNAPDQSNGIAYNPLNGNFYYFKRTPVASPTEFVSFDPATNLYTILSSPVTTNEVYSGAITNDGSGYYCWDTQGTLFYYNIAADTWTTITTSLVDQYGKDVDSIIRANLSGDGAIDGNGNLWILPSSDSKYGVFRLNFPLPTSPVASVTVTEVVAMTPPPSKFVGISFNYNGEIFMITGTNELYRLEDNLSLTLMSTVTQSMGDLTSCNFPMGVLAAAHYQLSAALSDGKVFLSWSPSPQAGSFTYFLEKSTDNRSWKTIATGRELSFSINKISFTDNAAVNGRNYYRVRVESMNRTIVYSAVRMIELNKDILCAVWPNPVRNEVFIQNGNKSSSLIIFDNSGKKIKAITITKGITMVDLKGVPAGNYYMILRSENGSGITRKLIKK